MTPADIACGTCAQQPGEPCVNVDGTPFVVEGRPALHSARIEMAARYQPGVSVLLTDEAVLATGLI